MNKKDMLSLMQACRENSGVRVVMLTLAILADPKTHHVTISHAKLQELTHFSRRNVVYAIRTLEAAGIITTCSRFDDDGNQKANVYTLHVPGREE